MNKKILIYIYFSMILINSCDFKSEKLIRNFEMGLIYWPSKNSTDYDIKKGINLTVENSDILTAQIAWEPNTNNLVNDVEWISKLAKSTNRKLIINVDWLNNNRNSLRGNQNWSFKDPIVKEKFIRSIITVCQNHQPEYINLAVEINYLAMVNPNEFKYFLDIYNYTKSLIEVLSPKTKIGVTFQLQLLLGTHENWSNKESLTIIKAFGDNFDYIGISTYPTLNINSDLSISQLNIIETISTKKIAIFETSIPTIKHSQSIQYNYLKSLFTYIAGNPKYELLIWTSTIDICNKNKWEYNLGLLNCDYTPKKSFYLWEKWYLLNKN